MAILKGHKMAPGLDPGCVITIIAYLRILTCNWSIGASLCKPHTNMAVLCTYMCMLSCIHIHHNEGLVTRLGNLHVVLFFFVSYLTYSLVDKADSRSYAHSLVPRHRRGGGERVPGTHCLCMHLIAMEFRGDHVHTCTYVYW